MALLCHTKTAARWQPSHLCNAASHCWFCGNRHYTFLRFLIRTAKQRGLLGHHFTDRLLHWPFPIRESWAPATRHHFVQGQLATSSAQSNIQTHTRTQSKPSAHAPRLPYSSQLCQHVEKPAMASRSHLLCSSAPARRGLRCWGPVYPNMGQGGRDVGRVAPSSSPMAAHHGQGARLEDALPASSSLAGKYRGGRRGARGSVNHCILQAINTNSSWMDRQLDGQTDSLPVFN